MRHIFLLLLVLPISGCMNFTFDSTEYDHVVVMKETSDLARIECGTPEVKDSIKALRKQVDHQVMYTDYRKKSRPHIAQAVVNVKAMVDGLYNMYDSPNKTPSIDYCKQKTENISTGLNILLQELGKL